MLVEQVRMTIAPMGVRVDPFLAPGGKLLLSKLDEHADNAAALLALLANGKRLTIVEHLLDNEMSVGAIAEKVDLSQSALSQHLAKLRSMNLVETRRDRQMIYYSCKSPSVRRLLETLEEIFGKR
jgi:DNA-binding transcriptional ArsR family regulator